MIRLLRDSFDVYYSCSCQGGQLKSAWNYAKRTGLVDEACYPYLKSEGEIAEIIKTAIPTYIYSSQAL